MKSVEIKSSSIDNLKSRYANSTEKKKQKAYGYITNKSTYLYRNKQERK